MPKEVFFDDPAQRDQHIVELTGLEPTPPIGEEETQHLIGGGLGDVTLSLLTSSLRTIYDIAHTLPERYDLEPADWMQIGALALIEVVQGVSDRQHGTLNSRLRAAMIREAMSTKLLATIGENNHPIYNARGDDIPDFVRDDQIEPVAPLTAVHFIEAEQKRANVSSDEASPDSRIYTETAVDQLPEREAQVVRLYVGLNEDDVALTFSKIAMGHVRVSKRRRGLSTLDHKSIPVQISF